MPLLDLRKASGASITFQMYHEIETLDNDRLQVQVSTDGGTNWSPGWFGNPPVRRNYRVEKAFSQLG